MMMREWLSHPTLFVDQGSVNLDDLIDSMSRPGGIVRCMGAPRDAIMVLETSEPEKYAFIASMISEDE